MKTFAFKYCIVFYAIIFIKLATVNAQSQENIIKTAYLGKFANFIDWPGNNAQSDNVFLIAVAGDDGLCQIISKAFYQRKIKDLPVKVICHKQVTPEDDIDLLMLSSSKSKELEAAIQLCAKDSFLLVTESKGFAQRGAHVNFYVTAEQTLHFEMNKSKLDQDGFKVDFLLLDYAKVLKN